MIKKKKNIDLHIMGTHLQYDDELLAYCNSFAALNRRYTLPGDAFLTFLHISLLTTSIRTESLTPS